MIYLYIIISLIILGNISFLIRARIAPRPNTLGLENGSLAPVPSSPNCVSSFAESNDAIHYIDPLTLNIDLLTIRDLCLKQDRFKLIEEKENYLYFECRSLLFRYIDDLEIYCDGQTIHFRSASRTGQSDFGVNRKRIELIQGLLKNTVRS